jgi:spermidine/putrescine transport system permease protein
MVKRWSKWIYITLAYIFLYAPILSLIIFSFNSEKSSSKWGGFSLKWYSSLFSDARMLKALSNTLTVAIIAALVATILGTIAAIGINSMTGLRKKALLNINYLPILNPDIVTAVSLMTLFIFLKLTFGFKTLILAHIMFCTPYVVISVLPKLKQLPEDTIKAAYDLGATPTYALKKIIIPQIKPGIFAGFLIAFTMSIDDFVISFFNAGSGVTNLSIEIYSMARRGVSLKINALSTLMFITIFILLLLSNSMSFSKRRSKNEIR